MMRGGFKQVLPRGLYGRAALSLALPVAALLLVLSVVFIQRHYEGVAGQMTRTLSVGLAYLLEEVEGAADPAAGRARAAALQEPLALRVDWPDHPGPGTDLRNWDDLTGRAVAATLRAEIGAVRAVDLTAARREVLVWIDTAQGPMRVALERRRVAASNPHQLLVIVILSGLLMTGIAFIFLRNQLRPIKQLADAAEAFGRGQVLPYRPRGATEVRAAGRAFLAMRDRIERQIEQRTLMLSAVSHDLRTPLTRLKLGLALLEETPETEALAGDVADMERLVASFLDHVRDGATETVEPTDAALLVQAAVENAARSGREVTLQPLPDGAEAPLRPHLMARALDNLIGNALRYGRRCRVGLVVERRALRITVEDDGPGIPPEAREAALQPFARLDAARNQDRGTGVGLGLAIVADVVRGHGGQLLLGDSRSLGGLRAEIVLPR